LFLVTVTELGSVVDSLRFTPTTRSLGGGAARTNLGSEQFWPQFVSRAKIFQPTKKRKKNHFFLDQIKKISSLSKTEQFWPKFVGWAKIFQPTKKKSDFFSLRDFKDPSSAYFCF